MLEMTWNGHSNFLFATGAHRIIFDPFFSGNPMARRGLDSVGALDAILVTHGHSDHLGDAVELSKRTGATIYAPNELALFCLRRGAKAHAMNPGGRTVQDFGMVKMVRAEHSSAYIDKGAEYTGVACGFVVGFGGYSIYFAGDTDLFSDMRLIAELTPVDIALVPIGDNYTMGPEEAAKAVEFIAPRFVVPMHYMTFEVLEQSPDRFLDLIRDSGATPVILAPGETHRFG